MDNPNWWVNHEESGRSRSSSYISRRRNIEICSQIVVPSNQQRDKVRGIADWTKPSKSSRSKESLRLSWFLANNRTSQVRLWSQRRKDAKVLEDHPTTLIALWKFKLCANPSIQKCRSWFSSKIGLVRWLWCNHQTMCRNKGAAKYRRWTSPDDKGTRRVDGSHCLLSERRMAPWR